MNIAASILITLILLVPLVLLWLLRVSYQRHQILGHLRRKCEKGVQRDGLVDQRVLDDIQYLGEHRNDILEKVEVLNVLGSLATIVQDAKQYGGNGLEEIVRAIELVVERDSDSESFLEGVAILKRIVGRACELKLGSSADVGFVLRSLRRLGAVAFAWADERPARKVLDAVEPLGRSLSSTVADVSLLVLELGKQSLASSRFLVALQALSELESMTWPHQPLDAPEAAAYLGLLAHFWGRDGSARRRALSSLKGVEFKKGLSAVVKEAQEIHFVAARFDTADVLAEMLPSVASQVI